MRSNNELEKGAEERTCHFSHRHCSKPIYRFDIRLESEPKIPTPNFFNFPEKKLNFTIENLDNNGNEYIYISVPLVALKELPDYIKGNANYQFERLKGLHLVGMISWKTWEVGKYEILERLKLKRFD